MKINRSVKIRAASLILTLCMCFSLFLPVLADGVPNENDVIFASQDAQVFASQNVAGKPVGQLDIKASSIVLMDSVTGKVLYEQNAHEKKAPASITKIMTILLVMEALDVGKIQLEDKVTASPHACSMGGSQIWLEPDEVMTVDELLRAAVIASANDASVALAEFISGSEETFVELMNRRASELGMSNTTFMNACGLDTEGHLTTAYDIALMSKELMKYELITKYSTVWMDTLRGGKTALTNTNKLVRFYKGCTGLKTGTTDSAKKCISATAVRDNLKLIAVAMGSETSDERFDAARKLLDYGFSNFAFYKPEINKSELTPIKVLKGKFSLVPVKAQDIPGIIIPKGRESDIQTEVILSENLEAPVEHGQKAGTVTFSLEGEKIAESQIITMAAVEKMTYANAYKLLLRMLFSLKMYPDCDCEKTGECNCIAVKGICNCENCNHIN